jgi:predicted phage-related endonuclease
MAERLIVVPETEQQWHALRAMDVTSTESSALFDMSPYTTAFELWHRKREQAVVQIEAAGRMLWGIRLQDVIARGVAEDYGVKVRRLNAYMRLNDCRMGSSFDFEIVGLWNDVPVDRGAPDLLRELYRKHGPGNMEIKNVDALVFRDSWTVNEDKSIEAPGHIEIQVQHQMHVCGRKWAALVVLVGGNTPKVIVRRYDAEVGQAIEQRVRDFWRDVDAGNEPAPVYPGDAEFVCSLYKYAEPGKVFDGRDSPELAALCAQYAEAAKREKLAKEDKDVAKAQMLTIIGDAERAMLPGFTISAGVIGECEVTYTRKAYRNFKLTPKKAPTGAATEAAKEAAQQ